MALNEDEIAGETMKVLGSHEPTEFGLTLRSAFVLLQICQLTVTHPKIGRDLVREVERLGRSLQAVIAARVSPGYAEFLEMGWHREYDR